MTFEVKKSTISDGERVLSKSGVVFSFFFLYNILFSERIDTLLLSRSNRVKSRI